MCHSLSTRFAAMMVCQTIMSAKRKTILEEGMGWWVRHKRGSWEITWLTKQQRNEHTLKRTTYSPYPSSKWVPATGDKGYHLEPSRYASTTKRAQNRKQKPDQKKRIHERETRYRERERERERETICFALPFCALFCFPLRCVTFLSFSVLVLALLRGGYGAGHVHSYLSWLQATCPPIWQSGNAFRLLVEQHGNLISM